MNNQSKEDILMFKHTKKAILTLAVIGLIASAPSAAEAHEWGRVNNDTFICVVLPDNQIISYRTGDAAGLGRVLSRYDHHYYNPHERVFVVYNGYRETPHWVKKRAHKNRSRHARKHHKKDNSVVVYRQINHYTVADNHGRHNARSKGHGHH
jgi:hypothetical protein